MKWRFVSRAAARFTSKSIWMCTEFLLFRSAVYILRQTSVPYELLKRFFCSRQRADSSKSRVNGKAIATVFDSETIQMLKNLADKQ